MMSDKNKKVYGRKDEVVDRYIDSLFDKDVIEERNREAENSGYDEDWERNVCQSRDCRAFSVFVYDGMMLCFGCAAREIAVDKKNLETYREVLEELLTVVCRECYCRDGVEYWREYDTYKCKECMMKW